ncbi:uncharacterized protein A1O5_12857 [Cladophialophora psammophila CBS 110553]|uniref:Uncharacterized protein n=1 Tax=Cladophialophora psammophila CBS 110553 TaxID=1182543 RepID=W9VS17_9EURO|nr:uncharacterized protein A1O5_12857 [Cladophialophora psammophila CBS 110553]EXJ54946.1 hypothetical protein A1O5_12857 [Cladophialophora psammophila CBS 110553]
MAPSRGTVRTAPIASITDEGDTAVEQQSNSALISARRNLNYLISPTAHTEKPARFRTRALLRTVRYVGQFIIWRLVRWAKYVAVGALVAAVGATAVGGMISGVAWLAAPPTLGASIVAAGVWGVGRFAARRLHARWKNSGGDMGEEVRERVMDQAGGIRREGSYGIDVGPRAVPW